MYWHRPFLILVLTVTVTAARGDEHWQKLRANGAEVYYADFDLRAAFAKANPEGLSEAKLKVPNAKAKAFDWTKIVQKSHVLAQGDSINCWGFASLAALEYSWAIRNGGPVPALAVQPTLDRVGKNGTGYAGWALQDFLEHGTCEARDCPHIGKPAKLNAEVKMPYRLIAWGLVAGTGGDPEPQLIKRALIDNGPLVANVYLTPAFTSHKSGPFREDVTPPADSPTSHILLIVGWDDTKGRKGCWKVQNSWGEKWCESGFMWIEYGSNNIGHSACWVRAQSKQYVLPDDVHKRVTAAADPFPAWPNAKKLKATAPQLPTVTPAEALKSQGERVVVEFKVLGGDIHSTEGHVELFSETTWRNEQCLIVRILKSELGNFLVKGDHALLEKYLGKTIRVRGSVQMNPIGPGGRRIIEVAEPDQIQIRD
jgi:hypothetical protein